MSLTPIGDLSQSYATRLSISRLTRELGTLGKEVTTGLTADVAGRMKGDTAPLAAVERGLGAVSAYETAVSETKILTAATQLSLERSQARLGDLVEKAITATSGNGTETAIDAVAREARHGFLGMVADINASVSGVRLFAGVATDGPATRGGEEILADIAAAAAGATGAAELDAAIDAYFAPGGAFEANDYLGAAGSRAPVAVAPGEAADFAPRADADEIRAGLKVLARVAVLDAGALDGNGAARREVMVASVTEAKGAESDLIALQARGGMVEEQLERAGARAGAERGALERARLDMIAADPYEAATRLEQTQVQLQSLYAITARLSRLNLTDYLR